MNKIYHFCQDEKFINAAYMQFEMVYPGKNKFLVYNANPLETKYLKTNSDFEFISNIKIAMKEIPRNSMVIFHSLPNSLLKNICFLDQSTITVWFCHGYEVYSDPCLYSDKRLCDKITRKKFGIEPRNFKEKIYENILPFYRIIKPSVGYSVREQKLKKLKRIDYLASSFDEEYKQIRKITKLTVPAFDFWYYPLEKILDVNLPIQLEKTKILIGNSGFKSNNHLDISSKLKKIEVKNEDFIIPLSYGDKSYTDFVKESFILPNNQITFLEDFIKLEEYNTFLSDAKIGIFNTRRQQAIGNILALIYHGSKVFISEKNTFYHFLKRNRIMVFSYENDLNAKTINQSLKLEDIEGNRKKLFALLNEEKILSELKLCVDKIIK